jgi:hypothetical protein
MNVAKTTTNNNIEEMTAKLTSNITVRRIEKEKKFSITVKYNPTGEGAFYYSGHIGEGSNLEEALGLIREAIGKIAALV